MSEARICTRCNNLTEFDDFATNRKRPSGKGSYCKKCDNEKSRAYYKANKVHCNELSARYVETHQEKVREYQHQYGIKNKERLRKQSQEYYQANKVRIGQQNAEYAAEHAAEIKEYQHRYRERYSEKLNARHREYQANPPERQRQKVRAYHRSRYQALRAAFLQALGGRCYCCGLDDIRFLTIDHVENDGTKERKPNGKQTNSYTALRRMYVNFQSCPSRYRAACYNCNCARHLTEDKVCPHQKQ